MRARLPVSLACSALLLLVLAALPRGASAQEAGIDISGSWILSFSSSQGSVNLPVQIRQEGATLEGASSDIMGFGTDFDGGRVEGETFAFDIFVEVDGNWYPLAFSGRMEGAELTGQVDIPDGTRSTFRGTRAPSE